MNCFVIELKNIANGLKNLQFFTNLNRYRFLITHVIRGLCGIVTLPRDFFVFSVGGGGANSVLVPMEIR